VAGKRFLCLAAVCLFLGARVSGEELRVLIAGTCEVSLAQAGETEQPETALALPYNGSALIVLSGDLRFFRGVELELTAPREFLGFRGGMGLGLYGELREVPPRGEADMEARRLFSGALPQRLKAVYQIPLAPGHGLKTTPYAAVPVEVVPPSSFPLLFRLIPMMKGMDMGALAFSLRARPLLNDNGAVVLNFRYPEGLPGGSFTVLIDDAVVENRDGELLLKEGEHSLMVLSEDYRNESRRFKVERAKSISLTVDLKDTTPLLVFEAPENARIFLDNRPLGDTAVPRPVEPGLHQVRFQVGDYSLVRTVQVQKGRTYRIALAVDVTISEE